MSTHKEVLGDLQMYYGNLIERYKSKKSKTDLVEMAVKAGFCFGYICGKAGIEVEQEAK